eukprot:365408-Chlamydomonas_euryale.AAC.17
MHTSHVRLLVVPEGLSRTSLLGLRGSTWRTWDVIMANVVLARSLGHAISATHPATAAITNVVVPTGLVVCLAVLPRCGAHAGGAGVGVCLAVLPRCGVHAGGSRCGEGVTGGWYQSLIGVMRGIAVEGLIAS